MRANPAVARYSGEALMRGQRSGWVALLVMTACWSFPAQSADKAITASEPRRILVQRDSFICASVRVSDEIWPEERWEIGQGKGLSTFLVNGLRKNFRSVGKLGSATRFRTNDNGRDPVCSDVNSIYVSISYVSAGVDRLFTATVKVIHGDIKRHSKHVVDVDEEMRSGRLVATHGQNATRKAIFADVTRSADEIAANMIMH